MKRTPIAGYIVGSLVCWGAACAENESTGSPGSAGAGAMGAGLGGTTGGGGSDEGGTTQLASCPVATPLYPFEGNAEGFKITYSSPSTLVTSVTWDNSVGAKAIGSIKLTADFTGTEQDVNLGRLPASPLNLTGKIVTAKLHVDRDPAIGPGNFTSTNGSPEQVAGGRLYIKTSSDYRYANGGWANLIPGGWIPLALDASHPGYVNGGDASLLDLADIREIGVDIGTGASPGVFATGEYHLDDLELREGTISNAPPWDFDCGTENFHVTYKSDGALLPELDWTVAAGNPRPGALSLTGNFGSTSQELGIGRVIPSGLDLSGRTLQLKLRLDSASAADFGTAKLYVATGPSYVCAIGGATPLAADWTTIALDLGAPDYVCTAGSGVYDASVVNELGVILDTAGGNPGTVTLLVDTLTAE